MGSITVRPYGADLSGYEEDLAAILTELQVSLTGEEDLEALIEACKRIIIGDRRVDCFTGAWMDGAYINAFGFIALGAYKGIDRSVFDIQEINRVTTLRVTFDTDAADVLQVSGTGWSVTRTPTEEGETVQASYTLAAGVTRFSAYDALALLSFGASARVAVTITLSAVGQTSGAVFEGPALTVRWSTATWALIEDVYDTWGDIEAGPSTWEELENTPLPE